MRPESDRVESSSFNPKPFQTFANLCKKSIQNLVGMGGMLILQRQKKYKDNTKLEGSKKRESNERKCNPILCGAQ